MARRKKALVATEDTAIISTDDTLLEPTIEAKPDIFDEQIALRRQEASHIIVQNVADGMKMPDTDVPVPPTTASGGPGAVRENGGSFAEKVGKREPGYTNQGTRDSIAGARIHEYQDREQGIYLSIIKFDEKPSRDVTGRLREAHFDFSYENQERTRPIRYETRQQDRISADEVFAEVCKLVRESKGVSHSFGG